MWGIPMIHSQGRKLDAVHLNHRSIKRKSFFSVLFNYKYFPLFLLIVIILSYGLLIPWLSVFADDLSFLFYFRTLGRWGLFQALANERPIQGLLYSFTIPFVGTSPLVWQIVGLLTRWLASLSLFWMLNNLWPSAKKQIAWTVLLFTVFPAFLEHWVAVTYSHAYLMLAFAFLSLWSMLKSFSAGSRYWLYLVISILLAAINISMTEYFFGIELSRPIVIWIYTWSHGPGTQKKFRAVLNKYWPYFILFIAYVVWRFVVFHSVKYNIRVENVYGNGFFDISLGLLKNIGMGFFRVLIQAWEGLFIFLPIASFKGFNLVIWLIFFIDLISIAVYLICASKANQNIQDNPNNTSHQWVLQAFLLASISTLLALMPFLLGGYTIQMQIPWDRFLLAFMFPSSLFLIAVNELIGYRSYRLGFILPILFASLSMAHQFSEANSYRKALIMERNLFWQLNWRIPALQPGTILITDTMNLPYYSENTLSSQLNYLYDPELDSAQMKYVFAFVNGRIQDVMGDYDPGVSITLCDRNICFSGSTSDIVALKYFPSDCVAILDPIYLNNQVMVPELSPGLRSVVVHSQLERILTDPEKAVVPSKSDFGPEPPHEWCYYFEKADLAKQEGDWQAVINYWDLANDHGYGPTLNFQYYPFIEAFANVGDMQTASDLTSRLMATSNQIPALCELWQRIDSETPQKTPSQSEIVRDLLYNLDCDSK
jgi:hypothetical protein